MIGLEIFLRPYKIKGKKSFSYFSKMTWKFKTENIW